MGVAGEYIRALIQRGGVDNGVGGCEAVFAADFGGVEREFGVEGPDMAQLGEGDDLIGLVLARFAGEPFCQFKLDTGAILHKLANLRFCDHIANRYAECARHKKQHSYKSLP